jgi:PST family polysaccharide transporter
MAPVMSLVQIFNDLGLGEATVQKPRISQAELSGLFWLSLGVSVVLAAALAAAAPLVARFYGAPELAPIVVASAALLVFSGAGAQQFALLNRRMRFTALAGMDIACVAAASVCGLLAASQGLGAWSLVIMQGANSLTLLVLAWVLCRWIPSGPFAGGSGSIWALLRFGGHLTGFNLLAYAEANLGTVLIGRFNGAAALGFYDRAFKLVIVPWWQLSLPVARVAVSLLSRLANAEETYAAAWRRMFQGLMLVAAPGLLWAAILSQSLVPVVLGANWQSCAPMVTDLSLATVLVPFGASAYWLFVSQGRVAEQLRYAMLTGVILIASSVIGVQWGALGVTRCYAVSAVFVQIWPLWGATRRGPINGAAAWRATWPMLIGLATSAAGAELAFSTAISAGLPRVFCLALSLAAAYAACGIALLTFPSGRRIAGDVWSLRRMAR